MSDHGRIEYERRAEGEGTDCGIDARKRRGARYSALVSDLIGETSALLQAEAALARAEIRDSVTTYVSGVTVMGGGTGLLHAGLSPGGGGNLLPRCVSGPRGRRRSSSASRWPDRGGMIM